MTLPHICLVHPGHAMSTAWIYDGYHKYLTQMGCVIDECRTDKLIAFAAKIIDKGEWEGEQGVSADEWRLHLAQQFMLMRIFQCQVQKPDVTLVICGRLISPQNYDIFDMVPGNKVVLLTESPYEDAAQRYYAQYYDFAFTNDKVSVPSLSQVVPTVYMPHGYDSDIYHPEEDDHHCDVSFIGTPFGNRRPILDAIKQEIPNNFIFDATTMPDETDGKPMIAFVPPDQAAKVYHRTKVNLNIHRTETFYGNGEYIDVGSAYALGPRTYEIAGCAEFQICDSSREELGLVFGDTIATYDTAEKVVEQVRYWADDARAQTRRDMAMASYEIARRHTYAARARRLVAQLGQWYDIPDWQEQEQHV